MESEPSSPIHFSLDHSNEVASSSPATESSMLGNTTSGRTSRKRSACWEDFEDLEPGEQLIEQRKHGDNKNRARCKHCLKTMVSETGKGTSVKNCHILICPKRPAFKLSRQVENTIDQKVVRKMMAECVIQHGYPFEWVEHSKTRDLFSYLNNDFKPISRNTCKADCMRLHVEKKQEVKDSLKKISSRISLTCDLWSSCTSDGYLCLTAHYVDEGWRLCSKILNFHHVPPPHTAIILYNIIYELLREWEIEKNIFSITLDNASNMDNMQLNLRRQLDRQNALLCHGKYFHIRCSAHILNLIVQKGIEVIKDGLVKVRECVKYVEGSEGRKLRFRECVLQVKLSSSKVLWLDVPTRWNSTYLMLERFLYYRAAFQSLAICDQDFGVIFPRDDEFPAFQKILYFLEPFYKITVLFSRSEYPTSNLYFEQVCSVQKRIQKELQSSDDTMRQMASNMNSKFVKYWEDHCMVLSFAAILDPRLKLEFLKFILPQLGSRYANKWIDILNEMRILFEEYKSRHTQLQNSNAFENIDDGSRELDDELIGFSQYDDQSSNSQSELDLYLNENRVNYRMKLDVLDFWKRSRFKYPILTTMAKDLLCIPVTTVASESSFSMGGRVINKWRSRILLENAEMLITTRNWFCSFDDEDEKNEILIGRALSEMDSTPSSPV